MSHISSTRGFYFTESKICPPKFTHINFERKKEVPEKGSVLVFIYHLCTDT